ncbi:MAG: ABC transporter substrate-binding protein [Opitutales bacterium]|nr:ABC transporter substrate-binding protein [Opitutales bacterium]
MRLKFLLFGSSLIALAFIALSLTGGGGRSSEGERPLPPPGFPMDIVDAVQSQIRLETAPQRIVSLSPSVTETLFLLGGGDLLVGRSRYCINPEAALKVESVGGVTDPNLEKMGMLNPDLVFGITMGLRSEVAERMKQIGLKPMYFQQRSLDDIRDDVRLLSRIIDRTEIGEAWAVEADERREKVMAEMRTFWNERQPSALIFYYNPGGIFSAGSDSWPGSMLEALGLRNLANNLDSSWPRLSSEWILASNPEVIIYAPTSAGDVEAARAHMEQIRADPLWRNVDAIRNGRVIIANRSALVNSGPGAFTALEDLAETLQATYSDED